MRLGSKELTTQNQHLPALVQSSYQALDTLHIRRRNYDHRRAAELLQRCRRVLFASVDVHIRSKFFGEGFFLAAAG
jgi:hypothetical protein